MYIPNACKKGCKPNALSFSGPAEHRMERGVLREQCHHLKGHYNELRTMAERLSIRISVGTTIIM